MFIAKLDNTGIPMSSRGLFNNGFSVLSRGARDPLVSNKINEFGGAFMNGKDYFILGCKLFGVYCLVLGVPTILLTIPTFIQPMGLDLKYKKIMMATVIATRLLPVFYIIGGFYLLRGGERLYQLAYPDETVHTELLEGKLLLFIKMLGLFLIVNYFPVLLQTISSYITYTTAPMYYDLMQQQQFTYLNAASSVWGVGVGIYLLKDGGFVAKVTLKTLPGTSKKRK